MLFPLSAFLLVSFQVSPLFQKLETDQVEALKKRFGGQQVLIRSLAIILIVAEVGSAGDSK